MSNDRHIHCCFVDGVGVLYVLGSKRFDRGFSALAMARKTVFGPENDHLSDAGIIHKNPPSFTVGQTA